MSIGICIGILLGYLIGYSVHSESTNESCGAACNEPDDDISKRLMSSMNTANIRHYLSVLTENPHLAGTSADKYTAEYIQSTWLEQGFDSADIHSYDVLLSYPDEDNPNLVQILNDDDTVNYTCSDMEESLRPEDEHPEMVKQFNAYSAAKMAKGDLVYVNYARVSDFDTLESVAPHVNLTGKILIARYGRLFRGNKVLNAQNRGAIGMILYSDPADYGSNDDNAKEYPDDWWLPGTGAQRGNLHVSDYKGDVLTPGYPANSYMVRIDEEDSPLPDIPVQPIGYDDALIFLRELGGDIAPESWQGGLNISYRIGPGFTNPNRSVQMDIHTSRERRLTYNTIGFIRGQVEPDRYVIVGNHHDAWIYGSVDPSSGTASMLEISNAFGLLLKDGWRPRRSIIFCSWGAEEYGLIGSTEWVEEFVKNLGARSIAYLNVDQSVNGDWYMRAKASPLLFQAIFSAAKKVDDPSDPSKSVYDVWLERNPDFLNPVPYVSNLGSGSDFAPFMYRIGVPGADIRYTYSRSLGISSYPAYHSAYETLYLMETYIDPGFKYHLAVSRVWAELTRDIAEAIIIPFNCNDYTSRLVESIDKLKKDYETDMAQHGITFSDIDSAMINFTNAARDLHVRIDGMIKNDAMAIRAVNDQLMNVERAFIDPLGLPDRKFLRHIVFAPSSTNSYSSATFPGIVDAMFKIDEDSDQDGRWKVVEEQMSVAAFTIQSASTTMADYQM
uniref:N-acetylated-alpha-linked acidic dipeptidase 2 n=1 Tax=Saccoglossus kowalevskii TaxID=10224 RepID=A0ABM0H0F5_SACKO|nr:PREDICTED: N-acetylated-alpha-linked acidic dipeptidase 2 [Saccoglossus kowalevskii]